MRTILLFSPAKEPKLFAKYSIVFGDRRVKSSNHQNLVAAGEYLNLDEFSGEDDAEEDEAMSWFISEF